MKLHNCVLSFLKAVKPYMERKICDLTEVEFCKTGYKTGNEPPCEGWEAYDPSVQLTGIDAHYWLRTAFCTPKAAENEYLILRTRTGREGKWAATNPQGLLYLNGKMVQGLDTNHTEAYLEAETDYIAHNYFYTGMEPCDSISCKMSIFAVNKDVEKLYYDIQVPYYACDLLYASTEDYANTMSVLVDAVRMVDMREPKSENFIASVKAASEYLEREFYGKICTTAGKPTVHCIGHTHIDVEWLWTRAQTREKIQRSFSTAKALMDKYPEYKFMLSQPELYRYLREEAPEKYRELKALVAEGRWEPEGAMYLEADCNLTSGESLVRQILFGKRFFREEFGIDSKILFLPDVFGYSAALPQILKKSGVEYFVTSKISWNDTNTMPLDMFYWEGIDGTEIFTSFWTAQKFSGRSNGNDIKNGTIYNAQLNTSYVKGAWDRFQQKEYTNHVFMTYGFGDGGGGPTKEMLETQKRTARGIPSMPVTVLDTLASSLETAKGEFDSTCHRTGRTPKWVGELYLEFHRGTYTSIAKVKKGNRNAEFLLGNVETLSVTDLFLGGSYDAEGINYHWRKTLHNQFHDILPGSSIHQVYEGTDKDYDEIARFGKQVVEEKLCAIGERLNTEGGILLYNPTGFVRKAVITQNGYRELEKTVPAFGWTVVKAEEPQSKVTLQGLTAENIFYKLTLNRAGQIDSLFDKRVQREVFKGTGNVLVAFEDNPTQYDAWELEDYYKLKAYPMDTEAVITPVIDGTRAGFRVERTYMHSVFAQTVWLYSGSSRIDFETDVDWHEQHQIIKAVFPLNVHAMDATYDVQYGHLVRPTHQNTGWNEAKFETYAHKWVDMSENGYGVALLNNGKYGHAADGSKLSITLLKGATYPDTQADQGRHKFTYSLMPHLDDFRKGGVIEESYFLNQPLYERQIGAAKGSLPESYSFVSADAPNAVITAVKKAENGDGLIVRFYDAYDCKSNVTLTVPETYTKAWLCDLMENEVSQLRISGGKTVLPVSNFEIITVKFQ